MFLKADIPRPRAPCQFRWKVMVSGSPLSSNPAESRYIFGCGRRQTAPAVRVAPMPSLIRLIMVLGLLGGLAYGAMFALANFVQPKQREMTITIPPQKLKQN